MKTIKKWFEYLPETIKQQAINNLKRKNINHKADSLAAAINNGFVWAETPEGDRYWQEIHMDCEEGKYNIIPIKGVKKKLSF